MAFKSYRRTISDETLEEVQRLVDQDHPQLIEPAAKRLESLRSDFRLDAARRKTDKVSSLRETRDTFGMLGIGMVVVGLAAKSMELASLGMVTALPVARKQQQINELDGLEEFVTPEVLFIELGISKLQQRHPTLAQVQNMEGAAV